MRLESGRCKRCKWDEKEADKLLPNIDVMIRDCLLLHARSLIKFYTNVRRHETDITLSDFGIPSIDKQLGDALKDYEKSIEVHLLHLTDWRDIEYRELHVIGNNATKDRQDWDRDAKPIVELIFESLECVSRQGEKWHTPFKDLYDASMARYREKSCAWPINLCGKSAVEQYLKGLGL